MFTRKKFFWLSAVLVAASSYLSFGPVTASAAVPQPATEEMKLLVDPAVLQDRTAGWQQLWQLLQKTAAAQHIEVSESQTPFKEGCRSIHYLDTKDQALGKKNYILRQRIKIGKNGLSKHCDLMKGIIVPEDAAQTEIDELFAVPIKKDVVNEVTTPEIYTMRERRLVYSLALQDYVGGGDDLA